ncbi:MAG: hypothetical protein JKY56_02240, partial [Kofleriaceae bacterium]|nr:hypothetical protein [Kofleriaceae bacterium]
MSERCKQCETDLEGVESKKVAQWSFCLSCFDELMEASAKKKPATAADFITTPEVTEPERELTVDGPEENAGLAMRFSVGPPTLRCQTCKTELQENQSHAMLGTTFCANCYEVLVEGFSASGQKRADEP